MKHFTFPLLSLSLLVLIGCGGEEKKPAAATSVKPASEIKTDMVLAVGKVEPENDIVEVSAPAGGIVEEVLAKDGELVKKGQVLLQLDDDLEQSRMQEISTQIASQRTQISVEETQVKEQQATLSNKNALLARTKRLVEKGAETQQSLDDLNTEIEVLQVGIERAQARIQVAKSRVSELSAQLRTAQIEVGKKRFLSPYDGVVLDMKVNQGEALSQYATYAEFAPTGNLIVRAEVDELFSDKIKVGQPVEILYTGSDQVIASGTVSLMAPYLKKKSLFSEKANDQEDRRVLEVRIALKERGNLIINAKVECKIKL